MMQEKAYNKISAANQLNLFRFFDDLNTAEKDDLCNQVLKLDFVKLNNLYKDSLQDEQLDMQNITPIKYFVKEQLSNSDNYQELGEKVLHNGELAVLIIAGGDGTRLGYNGPKGTFKLDINGGISLFECFVKQLKKANKKYNNIIPWLIMTSENNYQKTVDFFNENNYFDYLKEKIIIFKQGELPILDINGNCVLKSKSKILTGPNGGGDVFKTLKNNGIINFLKENNIKWLHLSSVDNVLIDLIDEKFIGLMIFEGYKAGAKSYFKDPVNMKEYVIVNKNHKPFLLSHQFINEEFSKIQDEDGNYLYRDIILHNYILNIEILERLADLELPYHRAFKKYLYLNNDGNMIEESCFKFEQFIFDILPFLDNICVLRIEKEKEFFPLKVIEHCDSIIELIKNKDWL